MSDANDVLTRLNAALADRYALEREIGAGGMATVYLAQDLKHHRLVAVKVLRPDLTASLGPERFHREIEVAAQLQHPHILTLIDSGEADGFLFYVMPYVQGPTLRHRLVRERELPVGEAVRILRDVADALTEAHAHGVVHRDLKPENIMLSGRHALVADFGVAKAVSEATGRHELTTMGVALGTPAYMAPEQAVADPLTDHRADLYALGVVAYEMLTGEPPFVRGTPQAVLAAQVTEAPVPVTERRETVPPALAALVMRCLAKKPADRPQRAEEVLGVLEGLSTPSGGMTPAETQPVSGAATPARRKPPRWVAAAAVGVVAVGLAAGWALLGRGTPFPEARQREPVVVLPFEVQGAAPEMAHLGVRAAERLAAAIEGANVARVVAYRPGGGSGPFSERRGRQVLGETGAGTLVTGVIAQEGGDLEIQARVVRGSDLQTVWTLGPERGPASDPTPVLDAIQERVLGAVGWYLGAWSMGLENPGLFAPPPSLEIGRLAEKGVEFFAAYRWEEAVPYFRDAIARDTTWLFIVTRLNLAYDLLGRWQEGDSVLAFLEARRERLSRGEALFLDWLRTFRGSTEEQVQGARALHSAEPSLAFPLMFSLIGARRPAEALEHYALRDTRTGMWRDWQWWENQSALAYHMLSRFEEELALARVGKGREPRFFDHWARELTALAALGRTGEIEGIITESHILETQGAPVRLMNTAATELSLHAHPEEAKAYAERVVAGLAQWPDSIQALGDTKDILRNALRILGRHDEVVRIYEEQSRAARAGGLPYRILGMRYRILMGETAGALALVDSARTQPLIAFAASGWDRKGTPMYYGAHILSLLGRKDEAVALLREALNNGARLGPDEPLEWYWASIKDYPPFQELVRIR